MDGVTDVGTAGDDEAVQLEILRHSQERVKGQRQSSDRLRTRLTSVAQQAVTLGSAATAGCGALAVSDRYPPAFAWALGVAAIIWVFGALVGFRHLRSRKWAEGAFRPSLIRANPARLSLAPARFYENLAEGLEIAIRENDKILDDLADGLDQALGLTTAAAILGVLSGALVWLIGVGGLLLLVVLCALAGFIVPRFRISPKAPKDCL